MTKIVTDAHQFYLTAPSPCPYLDGRQERKVFTHLVGPNSGALHDLLTQGGFRRSQGIAYRPACESCMACVSVRVCVDAFRPTQSMRRVARTNRDLIGRFRPAHATSEQVQPVPPLSRQPPRGRRHGAHVGARLRADGGGQPCGERGGRIPPARPRQRHSRPRPGRHRRLHADRRALRRPVHGLLVLRPRPGRTAPSAPS